MTAGSSHRIKFCLELSHFFTNLVPNLGRFFPVETNPAGLVLHGEGLQYRGQGLRDAGQNTLVAAFFLCLYHLPVLGNLFRGKTFGLGRTSVGGKNMRMPEYHLFAKFIGDIGNIIFPFLLCNLAVKDNVKQYVAELFLKVFVGLGHNGIAKLVHLFKRHRPQSVNSLCPVPRTFGP